MANAEFIAEWNRVFPYKLLGCDLLHPSETIVQNALECYLAQSNINVNKIRNSFDDPLDYKIKLCQFVNYLYTLWDETNQFAYIDLIHPTSKKTIHLLKWLMNYYLYYKMMKEEVVEASREEIKQYEAVNKRINDFNVENVMAIERGQNINTKLAEFDKLLPNLSMEAEQYRKNDIALTAKISNLSNQIEKLNMEKLNAEKEIQQSKFEIVSDDEIKQLQSIKEAIDPENVELDEIKHRTIAINQDESARIQQLQSFIEKMQKVIEHFIPADLISSKRSGAEMQSDVYEINNTITNIKNLKNTVATVTLKMENLTIALAEKSNHVESLDNDDEIKELEKKRNDLIEMQQEIDELLNEAEGIVTDMEIERDFIQNNLPVVLEHIMKK